jgi:hypothetical protein
MRSRLGDCLYGSVRRYWARPRLHRRALGPGGAPACRHWLVLSSGVSGIYLNGLFAKWGIAEQLSLRSSRRNLDICHFADPRSGHCRSPNKAALWPEFICRHRSVA